MAWFKAHCSITMEIEARDADGALSKAECILTKRVIGQSFGMRRNDRGEVVSGTVDEVEDDKSEPEPERSCCPDCGEEGECRGHYGCQYPSNDPNIEGLEDPMMTER